MSFERLKLGEQPVEIIDEEEPHTSLEREEELEGEVGKLNKALAEIAAGLKKENVPVDDECRIDMAKFRGVYPAEDLKRDQEYVGKITGQVERRQHSRLPLSGGPKEKATGERMEMLKTAVFNKFLGNDFLVLRSAKYDDIVNKIDNVIIDRETGATVCAFDEVGETSGQRYEEKRAKVLARNHKEHGGVLKYGIRLEKGATGTTRLIRGKVENLPVFFLALRPGLIDRVTEEMTMPGQEPSEQERKLFEYFELSLASQAKLLEMEEGLNPDLKSRLSVFERIIRRNKN